MLVLVTATRLSKAEFAQTPLGLSLQRLSFDRTIEIHLADSNQLGLPKIYNQFIAEKFRGHDLVFVHDDLWLDDVFFSDRIRNALTIFNVVGLAGNRRLLPGAPAWHVKNEQMEWDQGNLSGVICHGKYPWGAASVYGPSPAEVKLLDGVLLAASCSALLDAAVRFDERFDFHFYDLDFSRQASAAGLKLGTWPIYATHVSIVALGSPAWQKGLELYREKWGMS